MMNTRNLARASGMLAIIVALLTFSSVSRLNAESTWYWDDIISTCEDPCPEYIEGWCWCRKLPPIIITP